MVLNDVYDVERDKAANRGRPLADGRIGIHQARLAGYGLMIAGILFAASVLLMEGAKEYQFATPLVAVFIAVMIWLYDGPLKATLLGPWIMGLCRVGSLLLGISVVGGPTPHSQSSRLIFGWPLLGMESTSPVSHGQRDAKQNAPRIGP